VERSKEGRHAISHPWSQVPEDLLRRREWAQAS
jgi:hypothetical protein